MKICVTGGTGSLGQALVRRLLRDNHERVVVLSRDEVKQAMMALDLQLHPSVRFFLGDVRDRDRLVDAFYGCDTVVHAAALKRVDAVAYNPTEVRRTNIEGSANVTAAAVQAGVKKVLMISSDKACHPTNIYGVTKAAMEHEAIASNAVAYPRGTAVSVLRYGNVLGSRGSVVHLWRQAVAAGEPIKITDKRMTRFWLTLDEAVDHVIYSLDYMDGGEIFVPDLQAMTLTDLAEAIAPGHAIVETGLRPGGEKLHETLMTGDEARRHVFTASGLRFIEPEINSWKNVLYTTNNSALPLTSDMVPRLTIDEMRKMLDTV